MHVITHTWARTHTYAHTYAHTDTQTHTQYTCMPSRHTHIIQEYFYRIQYRKLKL